MKYVSKLIAGVTVMMLLSWSALAAAPDHSFAADALGMKDPTWITILNVFFWLALGLIIVAVILEVFRQPKVRDRYTSAEYNEAVGLRRLYVPDGGEFTKSSSTKPRPRMEVGEALYIIGVIAVERAFALGVIALIVFAAVS